MREELYGPVGTLQRTVTYVPDTGVPVETLQRTAAYVPDTGVPAGAYNDDEVFALNYKRKSGLTVGSGAV